MARSLICGFELRSIGETTAPVGTNSVQNTIARTGYALRLNPTAGASNVQFQKLNAVDLSGAAAFQSIRFYLRIAVLPSVSTDIVAFDHQNNLFLNTDGTIKLTDATNANPVTSTRALSVDGLFHRIEFDCGWSSGSGRQVYVDGDLWASTATTASAAATIMFLGNQLVASSTYDIYIDDLLADNASFSVSGLPGDSKQILLIPTAGTNAGSWTDGAGGTGDIHASVASLPPIGAAAATAGAKIKNAASGTALDYVATMQTYIAGGIPAGSIINAIAATCNDGEEVTTGTKGGGIWCSANPAQSAVTVGTASDFEYGNDGGALGTFPAGWISHFGAVAVAPSVTLTTAPTVTVRKGSSTTRVVDVDFMGLYVDYTPPPIGKRFLSPQAVKRASIF